MYAVSMLGYGTKLEATPMKRIATAVLLACMLTAEFHAQSDPTPLETTQSLAAACRTYVRMFDDNRASTTSTDWLHVGVCVGYFQGFAAHHFYATEFSNMVPLYCTPTGVNNTQVIKVFLKYTVDHPEELHLPISIIVARAIRQA